MAHRLTTLKFKLIKNKSIAIMPELISIHVHIYIIYMYIDRWAILSMCSTSIFAYNRARYCTSVITTGDRIEVCVCVCTISTPQVVDHLVSVGANLDYD